eukprot:TRINITY_DN3400_c0_g1_i2.p1 TRINITY_DN3400_c0_g1~~TRINITY_DN3400_c0_g1_i2.p1  ORF type:complete len:583 (+),score=84.59 TRINITY_DN3400_c0_g1_i2:58-1806(+)
MHWRRQDLCTFVWISLLGISLVVADEKTHRYKDGEVIKLWVNKVGPYYNPQETYLYYTLPYCRATDVVERRKEGLGEALEGNELINSGFEVKFKENKEKRMFCIQALGEYDSKAFEKAVKNHYWYQMYIDELPIWGMVGEYVKTMPDSKSLDVYVYAHKHFSIGYNKDRIIEVNMTSENPIFVSPEAKVPWSYSVEWVPVKTPFEDRFDKYLDYDFFEHQIHWFSIFNSLVMVIFLAGIVALILMRTLKKDYARYSKEEMAGFELEEDVEESGWKQIHADVFRAPANVELFASLVGVGFQLVVLVLLVIVIALVGTLYKGRGSITTVSIVLYALTSIIGGFVSGAILKRHLCNNWVRNVFLTACIFPGFCVAVGLFLNMIALYYHSLAAIPFGTMLSVFMIWAVVAFPLTVGGAILGRNVAGEPDFPCRINSAVRPIPQKPWYLHPGFVIAAGGLIPFGSIFIEMYFVFSSFWNYKFYYVYGFMLSVYFILIIVTVCVTIVSSYFLLNSEDHRWAWTSFLSAASTSGYVFLYAIYYFFSKTHMFGFFQTMFYFGYMSIFCLGLALFCGTFPFACTFPLCEIS